MRFHVLILLLLAGVFIEAFSDDQELPRLIARAEFAPLDQQPHLCSQIAERLLKTSDQLYADDKVEQARSNLNQLVKYSDQASDAAIKSGKHLKDTEISMRRMAEKLRDIKRKLVFEDQAPVQAAADHLESLRTNLLNHMFKGKK